jgi:hypothetical protein
LSSTKETTVKHRSILILALLVCAVVAIAATTSTTQPTPKTLELTGILTGDHVALDAKPNGPSAGDIVYVNGLIFDHGKRVGRYQGVCTTMPHSSQQCSFTIGLPDGQLIVESGYGPSYNTGSVALEAVVGGTGAYANARGQVRDREVTSTRLSLRVELVQ